MSEFLVICRPLENLRLISEGQYRTETQSRYEALTAKNNSFKKRFLNAAVVSAFVVIIFADRLLLSPKTVVGATLLLTAVWMVICPAPAKFASKNERLATQAIFAEVARLVDDYTKTKIEALQGLLYGVRIYNITTLPTVLDWAKKLYDDHEQPFAVPIHHPQLDYSFTKKEALSRETQELRNNTAQVTAYALKIFLEIKPVPSPIQAEWELLKQACERLVTTNCELVVIPCTVAATSWEIAIKEPAF